MLAKLLALEIFAYFSSVHFHTIICEKQLFSYKILYIFKTYSSSGIFYL